MIPVAEGSIRLGILKVIVRPFGLPCVSVAEGSIRLGILKDVYTLEIVCSLSVAEGSIRLGILKDYLHVNVQVVTVTGCRGLDPIGDTESWRPAPCPVVLSVLQRARSDWGY